MFCRRFKRRRKSAFVIVVERSNRSRNSSSLFGRFFTGKSEGVNSEQKATDTISCNLIYDLKMITTVHIRCPHHTLTVHLKTTATQSQKRTKWHMIFQNVPYGFFVTGALPIASPLSLLWKMFSSSNPSESQQNAPDAPIVHDTKSFRPHPQRPQSSNFRLQIRSNCAPRFPQVPEHYSRWLISFFWSIRYGWESNEP